MKIFQKLNGTVCIVNGEKSYTDTADNFNDDCPINLPNEVIYDSLTKQYVINGIYEKEPMEAIENIIESIDVFIASKAGREYKETILTFEELQSAKLIEANNYIQSLYVGGFTSSASGTLMYYDSSADDQSNIDKMLQASQLPIFDSMVGGVLPVRGCIENNGEKVQVLLNAAQIQQLWTDMTMHIMAIKQKGWALTDSIKDCKTVAELDAIVIG